ncbi:MAG TPA: hypothetical protein VF020_14690 [Chthoniobacterales bacterium]
MERVNVKLFGRLRVSGHWLNSYIVIRFSSYGDVTQSVEWLSLLAVLLSAATTICQ